MRKKEVIPVHKIKISNLLGILFDFVISKGLEGTLTPHKIQEICKKNGLEIDVNYENFQQSEIFNIFGAIIQSIDEPNNEDASSTQLLNAIINTEHGKEERVKIIGEGVDSILDHLITLASILNKKAFQISSLRKKCTDFNDQLNQVLGTSSTGIENKELIGDFKNELKELLEQGTDNLEVQLVGIYNIVQILKPYLIERFTDIDLLDKESIQKEYHELRQDIEMLFEFYESMKDFVYYSTVGKTSLDPKEMSKKLSDVGPLLMKLLQRFGKRFFRDISLENEYSEKMVANLMESEHVLTKEEKMDIVNNAYGGKIPPGLEIDYSVPVKEASIAVVLPATYTGRETEGKPTKSALKFKKPGVESKSKRNKHIFQIIVTILSKYKKSLVGDENTGSRIDVLSKVANFMLDFMERTFATEFDFPSEMENIDLANQKFSNEISQIPRVWHDISNENVIAMERIDVNFLSSNKHANAIDAEEMLTNLIAFIFLSMNEGFVHGDPHARNFGQTVDGTKLGVFDWGQAAEIDKKQIIDFVKFGISLMLKRKNKIAKYFVKFQDIKVTGKKNIFDAKQIMPIIEKALAKHGKGKTILGMKDLNSLLQDIVIDVAIQFEQSADSNLMILGMSTESLFGAIEELKSKIDGEDYRIESFSDLIKFMFSERKHIVEGYRRSKKAKSQNPKKLAI